MVTVPVTSVKYTALRVIATVLPIALAVGATLAVFLAIPAITNAVKVLVQENNALFWLMVLLPALAMAIITTVLAAKILWSASEPVDDYQEGTN